MNTTDRGMTMRQPATRWQDALPTGDGIVGAMMYGQIQSEVILLNHERLYRPRDRAPVADVSDLLPEVRRLIEAGRYMNAQAVMPAAHAERGGKPEGSTSAVTDPYQPVCDIRIGAETRGPFRRYRRGVDFRTGVAWTRWEDGGGPASREVFVSRASGSVVLRICTADAPGRLVALRLAPRDASRHGDGAWAATSDAGGLTVETGADPGGGVAILMAYPGSFAFGAVGRVEAPGGIVHVDGDRVIVEGAGEIVLRVRLFVDEEPGFAVARLRSELDARPADFESELAAHAALHASLFDRVRLDLGGPARSNEEMLLDAYDEAASPELVRTMFDFGRHLLICSSGAGEWPSNLQGIWNGDYEPAWNSDFHMDENVQMNTWPALPGALPEAALSLFAYLEHHIGDYRDNAQRIYGCRGILVPIAQTTHGIAYPNVWTNWTGAAGWLAQSFYDYYLYTGDRAFLADRAVPWLREVAAFYEDFLTQDPDGRLRFAPSLSPENVPAGEGMSLVTANATMDVAICREVLGNLCEACAALGIEVAGQALWRAMLDRLPAYTVNPDGALCEWTDPRFPDNYHHRHQSHLYPLFPGFEVTRESDRALHEACRIAVEKRLVIGLASQSGCSMAHMANTYARLGEGDRALECIDILARGSTGPNLLTYHNDWRAMGLSLSGWGAIPPFQIDANFGVAAAILEMLVFSKPGCVKLLPALPRRWERGSVRGIACRGGITVDVTWDALAGTFSATLTSRTGQLVAVHMPRFAGDASVLQAVLEPGVAARIGGA